MITWLTPDYGRVTTVIKGACRPKSFFLGQTDLAYRCELLFYRKEHAGAHFAREVCPLDCREGLRGNWRASVAADYMCWLVAQVSQPMLESSGLYAHLDRSIRALTEAADGGEMSGMLSRFEFTLLDILGIAPNFDFCRDCTLSEDRRKCCRFVLSSGKLGCIHALSIHRESPSSVALTPSLVSALAATRADARLASARRAGGEAEDTDSHVNPAMSEPRIAIGIRRFIGLFMAHHLDIPIQPRSTAYAWLDWDRYDRTFLSSDAFTDCLTAAED